MMTPLADARLRSFVSRMCRWVDARRTAFVGAATLTAMQCAAFAQETPLRPPKVNNPPSAPKIFVYLVLVLLVGGVIFAATLKCKRTHLD